MTDPFEMTRRSWLSNKFSRRYVVAMMSIVIAMRSRIVAPVQVVAAPRARQAR